jgi:hypothetical protein
MNFENAQIVREPVGAGEGYWAGAPGAFYSPAERAWYLTFRIRRPRGVAPDRGGEAIIARSANLRDWQDIWRVNKNEYGTASIERSAIHQGPDGVWRYFTSFVDPADGRWCVAVLRANSPESFKASEARKILTASPLGLEGIKDPWIMQHDRRFYMFLSVALPTSKTSAQSHSTLDIYNTGECVSATGLAISEDLENWQWIGVVFKPGNSGWDKYCRRINSVVGIQKNLLAFYDGSASHAENYEEKTGLAASRDFVNWTSLSPDKAAHTSPHASGSLRYVDAQVSGEEVLLFYEFARADRSHDLRLVRTTRGELASSVKQAAWIPRSENR